MSTASRLAAAAYAVYLQMPFVSGGHFLHPQPVDAERYDDKKVLKIVRYVPYAFIHVTRRQFKFNFIFSCWCIELR
jgi:hypothetical protein